MTDRPYTDADLRAEAAGSLDELVILPSLGRIGTSMRDAWVGSTLTGDEGSTWGELLPDPADYATAQRKIHDLITGAANTSTWAVQLGADGLQPDAHRIEVEGPDGDVAVRLHFAFDPDMPQGLRDELVTDIRTALAPDMPLRRQH